MEGLSEISEVIKREGMSEDFTVCGREKKLMPADVKIGRKRGKEKVILIVEGIKDMR